MGRLLAAAALGTAVLALTGCSGLDAGEAAVSDEFRVSQAEVDAEVRLALESVGQPTGQPPAGLATATTQRLVQDALFAAKADELGVQVTPGDVEQGVAALAAQNGGQQALEDLAKQSGVDPGLRPHEPVLPGDRHEAGPERRRDLAAGRRARGPRRVLRADRRPGGAAVRNVG